MFQLERGFNMRKLNAMETVVVRLASFACNIQGVSNIPARFPTMNELDQAAAAAAAAPMESIRRRQQQQQRPRQVIPPSRSKKSPFQSSPSTALSPQEGHKQDPHRRHNHHRHKNRCQEHLAKQILKLASKDQGLFYHVNSREYEKYKDASHENNAKSDSDSDTASDGNETHARHRSRNHHSHHHDGDDDDDDDDDANNDNVVVDVTPPPPTTTSRSSHRAPPALPSFWIVSDEERELFSRLAAMEAMDTIRAIDQAETALLLKQQKHYHSWFIVLYRVCASAGACGFWFHGSWWDMLVAGILAVLVAYIGTSSILSKQERLVYEVIASFVVGLTAGLIALNFPNDTCFAAMAIAGIMDLLQGFRVVYAIIEIMSKHTVAGGADLIEGVLFTGLIAYFLRFGQYVAVVAAVAASSAMGEDNAPITTEFAACTHGIEEYWYIVFVPLTALSWSGLFTPSPSDLIPMALHGTLAFAVNYSLTNVGVDEELNTFVSASVVSLSAGIVSRFTGRQAVGNTVAGMYVLVPGAYLVTSMYPTSNSDGGSSSSGSFFFMDIITRAIIIGIGGWTGTILCSPTLLGTTRGLMWQHPGKGGTGGRRHGATTTKTRLRREGWRGDPSDRRQYRLEQNNDDSQRPAPVTMLYF
jgi:uncharacterized membrane protein YjjP (DUF1212 family)